MKIILETDRLTLREMGNEDFSGLCGILQDREVMYAYEHAFSDGEVRAWFEKSMRSYVENGFGLWAVDLKSGRKMIGNCGLTIQKWGEREVPEIGYLLRKDCWHKGYASEAAAAVKEYAFGLGFQSVYSIIRDSNTASRKVAERNGMVVAGSFTKHYYGIDMPHLVYEVNKN